MSEEFWKIIDGHGLDGIPSFEADALRTICTRLVRAEAEVARLREAATYQERVHQHFRYVAGDDPTDMPERRDRAGEESAELQQALGQTLEGYIAIGRYVWGRPAGDPGQEMGGALNTLAALAAWADLDMMACAEAELARTMRPEIVAKIRHKRSNRHGRGPLPGDDADLVTTSPTKTSGERPMTFLPDGWGGGEWVDRRTAWPNE